MAYIAMWRGSATACYCCTPMGDDRKIPAVKLFVSQLNSARQPVEAADVTGLEESNLVGLVVMGVEFTRVWVQVRSCCKLGSTPESADSNALVLVCSLFVIRSCIGFFGCPLKEEPLRPLPNLAQHLHALHTYSR